MTPEERSLLQRTYALVEENNVILRGIRRANRWGVAIKIFYWLVIIGVTLGAFYFVQPYIETTLNLVDQAQESIRTINGNIDQVQGAMNVFKSR
jgi:hypothetical protein